MKKYFLTFLDDQLEKKYQEQLRQIQYLIFFFISIASMFSLILLFFTNWISRLPTAKFIVGLVVTLLLIQFIVIYYRRRWVSTGLFIISLFSILGQVSSQTDLDVQQAFTSGGSLMAINVILLYGLEFKYGIMSNAFSLFVREFYIFNYNRESYLIQINVAVIHVSIFFCLYYKEQYFRKSFLQNTNNQLLEKAFSILQEQAFFIFQFDQEKLKFNLKDRHSIVHEDIPQDFNDFIRHSVYQEKSLELFLFYQIKQQSLKDYETINNQILEVQYRKKQYQVKLVEIFLSSITFFVILKPKNQKVKAQAIQKNNALIMKQIYQFSASQEKFIKNFIHKYTQKYQLLRLRRYYFQVVCAQRLQLSDLMDIPNLKQVNLAKLIKSIITLFKGFRILLMEQCMIQIDIVKLHLFLVELFNIYESNDIINIQVINQSFSVMLIIFSPQRFFKNQQLQRIQDQLVIQIIKDADKTIYIFNQQSERTFVQALNFLN